MTIVLFLLPPPIAFNPESGIMARICLVLFTALLLQAVGKAENPPIDPKTASSVPLPVLPKGSRVLFQGDSITDGNRGRNEDPNHILGHGYQFIIACRYGSAYADQDLAFFNRGVSGNTVTELKDRWQKDTLDLKPDLLSILIGINDEGRGIPPQQYEESYDYLLTKVRELNPKVRLPAPHIAPKRNVKPIVRHEDCSSAAMGCAPVSQQTSHGMMSHAANPCTSHADSHAHVRTFFSGA